MGCKNILELTGVSGLLMLSVSMAYADGLQDVAREIMSGRASILIVGDSTNNPDGAASFVPYYEGLLRRLPAEVELCGFRPSSSLGNTALNRYIVVSGGTTGQMEGGGVDQKAPTTAVASGHFVPPGYRYEFRIREGGSLFSYARFVSARVDNLDALLTNHQGWGTGLDLVLRTRFVTGPTTAMLDQISVVPLTGAAAGGFTAGSAFETLLASSDSPWGIDSVDVRFPAAASSRIGVEFRGDFSNNDASDESGKSVAWCGHLLFDEARASVGRGIFFDCVAVGGFTAGDFEQTLSTDSLGMYLAQSPRPVSLVIVWLGQNMELDEWTGQLQPAWVQRIETVADRAIAASVAAGATEPPAVLLVTPPQMRGEMVSPRFVAVANALETLAASRSWGHLDFFNLLGRSLGQIDEGFAADIAHPTLAGSEFVADRFYEQMACLASDLDTDGQRNFFDVVEFIALYTMSDPTVDLNGDGRLDFFDLTLFIQFYQTPCIDG